MVRPVNSKRKLFNTNKEQFKENEPGQLSSSNSSDLAARAHNLAPCIYQVHQCFSKKSVLVKESICELRNNRVSNLHYQKRCDSEDAGSTLTPSRTPMPMSERQQIALLLQLSSPSPTSKTDINLNSPCTPTNPHYSRGVAKRNERGETPLHVAAIKGDTEKVSQLITQGANVNATDYAGWTALHEACNRGFVIIASLLIEAGADVNAKGLDNDTPLHDACINNHYKIVRLLLKSGAKSDFLNKRGKSPRDVCRSPHILYLIEQADAGLLEDLDCSDLDLPYNSQVNHLDNFYSREFNSCQIAQFVDVESIVSSEADMSRRTPPNSKLEEKSAAPISGVPSASSQPVASSNGASNNGTGSSNGRPGSPRVTLRLPPIQRTPDKSQQRPHELKGSNNESEDIYEFRCSKDESKEEREEKTEATKQQETPPVSEAKGDKRPRENEGEDEEEIKKKKRKEENKDVAKGVVRGSSSKPSTAEKGAKSNIRNNAGNNCSAGKQTVTTSSNSAMTTTSSPTSTTSTGSLGGGSTAPSTAAENRKSPVTSAANSPKPVTGNTGKLSERSDSEGEEVKNELNSGAPKVPPLKIVLAPCASSEQEMSSQNGKNGSNRQLPYVVNSSSENSDEKDISAADNKDAAITVKEDFNAVLSSPVTSSASISVPISSGCSNSIISVTTNTSCTVAASPSVISIASSCSTNVSASSISISNNNNNGNNSNGITSNLNSGEKGSGTRITRSQRGGSDDSLPGVKVEIKQEEPPSCSSTSEVVHPRKRKLKMKEPEPEQPTTSSGPEQPVTNSYEMYLKIRRQIERRRKLLFPVQPKPPQGFKDYLMNRCSYVLANNSSSQLTVPIVPPPPTLAQAMKDLFNEQEQERHRLKLQQLIEKEKLVLSVEQEILRVHGRAARALANQVLPFSVCTILKDEEVYNIISAEQEEKDRNARSRYNGRLFISWLQDVDDKWEKIKEAMVLRHHNEAESLHAVQKMDWEWKQKELGLVEPNIKAQIDEMHVPMVQVADFDLLPA